MNDKLTLEDLEKQSGLPVRTIRFYIQEGLLQGPETRGKFASYSRQHLERLEMITRIKERTHLPLEEIRRLLTDGSPEQIQQMREILQQPDGTVVIINTDEPGEPPAENAGGSAMDYIHALRESPPPFSSENQRNFRVQSSPLPLGKQDRSRTKEESWQRVQLEDGIELHIRAGRDRRAERNIQKLLDYARKLFPNEI